jgi:hypothetical protein
MYFLGDALHVPHSVVPETEDTTAETWARVETLLDEIEEMLDEDDPT